MTERAFGWWLAASLALHMAGIAAGSFGHPVGITPSITVPIEVVRIPTPEPPPPPPPPRVKPVPPRIVQRPPEPKPVEPPPLVTPKPIESPPPPAATPPPPDSTLVASAPPSPSAPVGGAPASAGALFSGGDLPVASGSNGSPAPSAPRQDAPVEAKPSPQVAVATNTGLTKVARPIGEYQVKPDYPESARKDRAEGTTVLRVEVLANGRVGEVVVARSAGRGDFDQAAIAAVKQWHFEPARRGSTAVAMWATLPVLFKLSER
jgi:protein TonB